MRVKIDWAVRVAMASCYACMRTALPEWRLMLALADTSAPQPVSADTSAALRENHLPARLYADLPSLMCEQGPRSSHACRCRQDQAGSQRQLDISDEPSVMVRQPLLALTRVYLGRSWVCSIYFGSHDFDSWDEISGKKFDFEVFIPVAWCAHGHMVAIDTMSWHCIIIYFQE